MISISKNDIKSRAAKFAKDWEGVRSEKSEAQSFENDFFNIFGINRRKVAVFEHKIKFNKGEGGFIDLLWKGQILIEMKSTGQDLNKAYEQAKGYANTLDESDLPRLILVCDFETWVVYDLNDDGKRTEFKIHQLPDYIHLFYYLAGYEDRQFSEEDPVNTKAAELMGKLYDSLKAIGYESPYVEEYMVRLLFCLFADDTGIFGQDDFHFYIREFTQEDGSDLAAKLAEVFQILNTPVEKRFSNLSEQLAAFPYVNGGLFQKTLPLASFDARMRDMLIECCKLSWSHISPAIFGSMFQSVMDKEARRNLGAHYTSERNILKVINPLFMNELRAEFATICADRSNRKAARLEDFHQKLGKLTFLDPACGCGNFLIIAYRELRLLELEVIKTLRGDGQAWLDISALNQVHVSQFYGIELEEFPSQIAQVAMWLIDHQMNVKVSDLFGQYFARIPLVQSATIVQANALELDWQELIPASQLNYIFGNPPFKGARSMSAEQKQDLQHVFHDTPKHGDLDFVSCWYKKSASMMQNTSIKAAFVSTNSICQGQQVPILWGALHKHGVEIDFAYRTFKWVNEGRGVAAVHCVIIGFSIQQNTTNRFIVSEDEIISKAHQINGYLIDAPYVYIESRKKALCDSPSIGIGNQPIDDGNYLLTETEKNELIKIEPLSKKYLHRWFGAEELIKGKVRYILWLGSCSPSELKQLPECLKRIDNVKRFRAASKRTSTLKLACTPTRFQVENMPTDMYIALPQVSSERRDFIPMCFMTPSEICGDKLRILPNATLYHFGVLTSTIHMDWMRAVGGRLKADYSYSIDIIYNNFPWPQPDAKQKERIEKLAQGVLDARALYPDSTLADLYDPLTMPHELAKAHEKLDAEVEKAYGKRFKTAAERVAHLFELYQSLASK